MAVVGAGVIGIEYASMFAALGTEVTLIDRQRRPLEFLDAIFNYPTLAECYKVAALDAANKLAS